VMVYAALDGWRRQMVEQGHALLDAALGLAGRVRDEIEDVGGLHVLRDEFLDSEASHDLDPLHVVIDVSDLGVSGYDAADWLREHQRIDMGLSDHRRIEATLSQADDDQTAALVNGVKLALSQASNKAGKYKINYTSLDDSTAQALESAANSVFRFGKSVLRILPGAAAPASLPFALRETLPHLPKDKPLALVCSGNTCFPPTSDPEQLKALLIGKFNTAAAG